MPIDQPRWLQQWIAKMPLRWFFSLANIGRMMLLAWVELGAAIVGSLMGRKTALAESDEKFTIIFRSSPDPIVLTRFEDGFCIEVNDSFLKLLDYARDEMIGQQLMDLIIWSDPIDRLRCQNLLQQKGQVRNLEVSIRTRTGIIKTLLLSAERIEIKGEDYILGIGKDISDRKRIEVDRKTAELALQESEATNRALLQAIPDLFIQMDRHGTYLRVLNPGNINLLNPDLIRPGHSIFDVLPRELAQQRMESIWAAIETGKPQSYEYAIEVNGIVQYEEARITPYAKQDTVLVIIRDITARKQAELARQQSEVRYRAIVEDQTELIGRALPDSTILFANDAYCRFFGMQQEDMIGKPFLSLVHVDDRATIAQMLTSLNCSNPTTTIENRVIANGQVRWLQWVDRALFDEQGNVTEIQSVGRDITELKQAEAALRRSETALLHAQQMAHLGSWEVDLPTREITWSEELFRILGLDPTQTTPSLETFINLVPVEEQTTIAAAVQAMVVDGTQVNVEHRIQRRDGSIRYVISKGEAILNDQNQVLKLYGTVLDITDRKQTEAALKESDARFRQLAETVQEGFFIFETATSEYSYLNPACIQLSGIPLAPNQEDQDYTRGMNHWFDNIHPDDRDQVAQALQAERQGQDFDQEYRFILPNGEIRWRRSKAFPLPDATGTIVRIVGTVEDITDRKQAEEALRESEERFRRAFDDAPIGISLVSETGQFLRANTFYCNLLGYTEAELMQLQFSDITHPADLAADFAGIRQMLAGEIHSFQMEKRYITKQGTIIPVIMQTAPIRSHDGQILYFVGHIQDIRDRLKVERMKDEFISVVSHELRTPLTSIRGALGILESGVFNTRPDKANHMLKIALTNSERLVRLVNDILDLERLQSGKVNLIKQSCQVAGLMQQAVEGVQMIADQSRITLSLTTLSAIVWADPDAIVQALTNLLSNAIKFSSLEGTVWLKAEMKLDDSDINHQELVEGNKHHALTHPFPYILFSVRDQGRGIPADKLEVIFEQFQQVDVSDSRQKGGTGLGLAICRNIIQQHGGQIWVESTFGEGSTFYFTMPLRKEQ